jgi:threonine dehydratase
VTPTPLEEATLAGRRLLLKREDVHPLGAFKWRTDNGQLGEARAYRR